MSKSMGVMTKSELLTYLQSVSIEEIRSAFNARKTPTLQQKRLAWQVMDTGVYDKDNQLISDKAEDEDKY